jgi:4-aminobutyrate aminotransferase-like enzyme
LVTDRATKTPDKELTSRLLKAALERGLILLSCGTFGNTVRVLVPLTITDDVIEEGLDVLDQALQAALTTH